jgi:hypothetical protein
MTAHAKGCAVIPLPMRLDLRVTGRVVQKDGQPAAGVTVEAMEKEATYAVAHAETDADGRYVITGLVPGEYYLGVSLQMPPTLERPYTRWYHPGVEDAAKATLVQIGTSPGTMQFDLTLPERQEERVIRGVVLRPDGQPVEGARVALADPRWNIGIVGPEGQAMTGKDGKFTLRGLDGTRYLVQATKAGASPLHSDAAAVAPGADAVDVTLVLSRSGFPTRR